MLESLFKLKANNTTASREIAGGVTTFLTMGYIIFVNPNILSATGMDKGALITVTILAAAFGTILSGVCFRYCLSADDNFWYSQARYCRHSV